MSEHQQVFLAVWEGRRRPDNRFRLALAAIGMSELEFERLRREAKAQERGFAPPISRGKTGGLHFHIVLTPMGGQPRR